MRITGVALRDLETVRFFPAHTIRAAQDKNRRGGMNHVTIGATSEREPELSTKPAKILKGIVFPIVENAPRGNHFHGWQRDTSVAGGISICPEDTDTGHDGGQDHKQDHLGMIRIASHHLEFNLKK